MKNVINDDGTELSGLSGSGYFSKVIKYLKKRLKNFDSYLFIIYGDMSTTLPKSRNFVHPKKILFWSAGENKQQPFYKIKNDYLYIFANYAQDNKNIKSVQLGYARSSIETFIPIEERLFNISFTGNLNRNRIELVSLLSGISELWIRIGLLINKIALLKLINILIRYKHKRDYYLFTEDFGKGLDTEDYHYIMSHSKIILCPRGWTNSETFRLYEAMMHGCVIISEELPNRQYYKDIPIIQVKNWNEGLKIANNLLNDINAINELSKKNKEFYKKNLSPSAMANRIIEILNK